MLHILGRDCELYYSATEGGTYTLAGNVSDVTLTDETGETVTTKRSDGKFATSQPVHIDLTLNFKLLRLETGDAVYAAFLSAKLNQTEIYLRILDASGDGPEGAWWVKSMNRDESIGERVVLDVTCRPVEITDWLSGGAGTYNVGTGEFEIPEAQQSSEAN